MTKSLVQLHKFFASQSVYAIVLSTGLALSTYAARVLISENWLVYRNLVWNLFLAWLPYGFSITAFLLHRAAPRQPWLLLVPGALWLLFFPNAPYLITDFLHLEQRPYVPLWYDILLLATFAWTGIFLAVASLRTMQLLVENYLGRLVGWVFVVGVIGLSGLGIYLGRFERWNSWDFFFHPQRILADIAVRFANPTENLRFFGFTLLFTAFLAVCYLTFVSIRHSKD